MQMKLLETKQMWNNFGSTGMVREDKYCPFKDDIQIREVFLI